jgi:hypothetical protein
MATGCALLKNRTDDSSVYQIPAASRRDRPITVQFRESAVVPRLVTRRSAFTKVQQATASPWR